MRFLFISFLLLLAVLLFLQGRLNERSKTKPVFLQTDLIAEKHNAKIDIKILSVYQPDSFQLAQLKKDYNNLWAHLNNLYETNNTQAGKEYYTEDWFKQINHHYNGVLQTHIIRQDEKHELYIQNWSSDALVCTAIDSNIIFRYQYPDNTIKKTSANIAVVLLFQGDHWRIDAMRVITEVPLSL